MRNYIKLIIKYKFLKGNLLKPVIKKWSMVNGQWLMVIIANLPYVSKRIYSKSSTIKHESIISLLSPADGLTHYEKLLHQINKVLVTCHMSYVTCFLEFSPEQKIKLAKLVQLFLPEAKINFFKDLAGKWRVCQINLTYN